MTNCVSGAYEGSLPTSVMSVPCSVVTIFGARRPPSAIAAERARYADTACGSA
jgi:hypothetical protein